MKPRLIVSSCLAVSAALLARAAEKISVDDFSHEPAFYGMAIAPDGKAVVYGETIKGDSRLYIRDLETGKKLGIDLEGRDGAWGHSSSFLWANNKRIIFTAHGRRSAIDRDGKNANYRMPGGEVLYLYRNEEGSMLLRQYELAVGDGMRRVQFFVPQRPFIVKANTRTGVPMRYAENPGNVVAWGVNPQGQATVAIEIRGTQYRTLYRLSEEAPWETLPGMDWGDPEVRPVGFSADGKTLYLTRITPAGTWGIYPYDLAKRQLGELMLSDARYDIIPGHGRAYGNELLLQLAMFSDQGRELLGFRYMTDFPRTVWVDARMAEMQAALDQALPQKINTVLSLSDDLKRAMIFSWTASDPGTFYLFDRTAMKLEKMVASMPWIDPAKMAEVLPVRFKARDGLLLNGYMTFPKDRERKNLPLVVIPHSDPWSRDTWSFDSTAQFLANRGYAVLQVNYRGSSGYGEPFRNAGKKKLTREVQFDLADGVRWAIRQNLVDPARVGIVGFGAYGGYAALMGLALEPDLYHCGVASAPFTDLVKVIDKTDLPPDDYAFLTEWVGDPATEKEMLRAASPLNLADKITAPVLLIHDKQDDDWSFNQTKAMAANLKKAGRQVEFNTKYDDLRYGYQRHAKWLSEIEAFLAKTIPADK